MLRENLTNSPHFQQFLREVEQQLRQLLPDASYVQTSLNAERQSLEEQCRGWLQSLARPSLPDAVRIDLERAYGQAQNRLGIIASELASLASQAHRQQAALDADTVAAALQQLGDILASQNPSAANLMLSQHIDGIYCGPDGRVVVRTCKLGALSGVLEAVPQQPSDEENAAFQDGAYNTSRAAEPRRRARRNIGDAIEDQDVAARAGEFAVDPHRFAGLGPEWFTEDVFYAPRRKSWAEEHAIEVAEYRIQNHASMEATARHFGKSVPTIREALRYAKEMEGIDAFGTEVSRRNRPHWARGNAAEVAAFLRAPGRKLKDAVAHFGKSEPTLRKALGYADQMGREETETDRSPSSSERHDEPIDGNASDAA